MIGKPRYTVDLIGKRYGKLVVVKFLGYRHIFKQKKRSGVWLCKCDCGGKKEVISRNLSTGQVKSCGCILVRKYPIDEKYFQKINREDKAYFFGFLLTDGTIGKNNRGIPNRFQISLDKKDKEILEIFKKYLKTKVPLSIYRRKRPAGYGRFKVGTEYTLSVGVKKMVEDLLKLGLYPNKTKTVQFPTNRIIPHKLMRHFIRGVWDGDGSFSRRAKNKQPNIKLVSGSIKFLKQKQKYLKKYKILNTGLYIHKKTKKIDKYASLIIGPGLEQGVRLTKKKKGYLTGWEKAPDNKVFLNYKRFYKVLYNNCSKDLFLKRKQKVFKNIIA